uniref:Metalloendopeptidase n=1 Tax=Ciona savignyi TaxID=51511 RepID=H2ZB72_CIOSA
MSNRQQVSLASGCWQKGTVIHEILHSLGFWHEQSRPDRDSHVRINYGNIYRGMGYNFNKLSRQQVNSRNSPYDIGSVMHYNSYAFSSNRQATITDLQGRTLRTQRNGFSREDIKQLNAMYGCRTTGTGGGGGTGTGGGTGGTCRDENAMCARWAGSGECQKNPRYMLKSCCLSCKSGGGGTCTDASTNCPAWARAGECRRNPGYMRPNCCRSCRST